MGWTPWVDPRGWPVELTPQTDSGDFCRLAAAPMGCLRLDLLATALRGLRASARGTCRAVKRMRLAWVTKTQGRVEEQAVKSWITGRGVDHIDAAICGIGALTMNIQYHSI